MVESVLGGQLAHVAADEFAFVVVDMKGTQGQVEFGEAVRRRIEEPLAIDHERIFITCSVGVSCFPDNGMTPQELLGQAEAAMLRAKFEGRNTVVAFANEQKQELEERRSLGLRLRDAIRDGQFVLHYQPQINGHDWQILGFEALVRWQSPDFGLLPPSRFLAVAEELGLTVDIGAFVLESACRQARAWMRVRQIFQFRSMSQVCNCSGRSLSARCVPCLPDGMCLPRTLSWN